MARKKKGLPFVVQPRLEPIIERIGTEDSGIIEIIRRGYLTVAEKTIVDQASADMSDQGDLLAAVREIARLEKKTVSEVFALLQSEDGNKDLLEKYTEQIAMASSSAKAQTDKTKIIAATALLMCRVDNTWSVEDSMELHPDLLDALFVLYEEEDLRSIEAFETRADDNAKAGPAKK